MSVAVPGFLSISGTVSSTVLGAGFVQVLVLVCVPIPHVLVHPDQAPKFIHPPSTEILFLFS